MIYLFAFGAAIFLLIIGLIQENLLNKEDYHSLKKDEYRERIELVTMDNKYFD